MKEIKKIYAVHFLAGLSTAASVTFTLYFLSHGINQAQIGLLFAVFMISLAILDIPTGGLSDIFGHKHSVAAGLFFQSLSFLLFFFFPNYPGFFLGMLAAALGLALQSGATSSLIYELLHKEGLHESFQKVFGRASAYFLLAGIIAGPLGSFIYKYYPRIPYLLAFIVLLVASMVVLLVRWEFTKKQPAFSAYMNTIVTGIHMTIRNRILIATVIIGIALTTTRLVFNQNISQPYQIQIGIDVAYIGIVAALVAGAGAFVSMHAYKLSQRIGKGLSLILMLVVPSVTIILLSLINTLLAVPLILLFYMGHAFRDPVMAHISQDEVERDKRATMASTVSFLVSISAGLLLPYFGGRIDMFGINNTLVLLGIFSLVVGGIGLLLFGYKHSSIRRFKAS
ncbi:MAG: MFS transporter [Candidatus Levybacteria bacterium]|nr:MFS transporter [Candidatus Levybacteria bacterium]